MKNIINLEETLIFIDEVLENKSLLKNSIFKSDNFFFTRLFNEIDNQLDLNSSIYIYLFINKYNIMLRELRINNISTATLYQNEISNLIDKDKKIPNQIIKTMANNVLAFKEYKNQNYKHAIKLLLNSIEIDCSLEKLGFEILHFHKIQTIHNIARIYLKSKKKTGLKLSTELLSYLSNSSDVFYYKKFIFNQEKNSISIDLCSALFLQILDEIVIYLIKSKNNNEIHLFRLIKKILDNSPNKNESFSLITKWLNIVLRLNKLSSYNKITLIYNFIRSNNEKMASLNIFLIKKLINTFSCDNTISENIKHNLKTYGYNI